MLVSAITLYSSIVARNNAAMAMMQSSQASMSALNCINPDSVNFNALHQMDTQNSLDMISNQLQYKVASAMEKQSKAQMKKELEQNKKLNLLA
jgi:hypothetical protein